ncbi:hypothetical protein ACH5RR_009279 [Cinchona calisaya]|uniref:Uncharacterized protein n=1 Tax=Cinchona calisaya TaxID=153742 RepID=A0ABD3AGR9_9GENT
MQGDEQLLEVIPPILTNDDIAALIAMPSMGELKAVIFSLSSNSIVGWNFHLCQIWSLPKGEVFVDGACAKLEARLKEELRSGDRVEKGSEYRTGEKGSWGIERGWRQREESKRMGSQD